MSICKGEMRHRLPWLADSSPRFGHRPAEDAAGYSARADDLALVFTLPCGFADGAEGMSYIDACPASHPSAALVRGMPDGPARYERENRSYGKAVDCRQQIPVAERRYIPSNRRLRTGRRWRYRTGPLCQNVLLTAPKNDRILAEKYGERINRHDDFTEKTWVGEERLLPS